MIVKQSSPVRDNVDQFEGDDESVHFSDLDSSSPSNTNRGGRAQAYPESVQTKGTLPECFPFMHLSSKQSSWFVYI